MTRMRQKINELIDKAREFAKGRFVKKNRDKYVLYGLIALCVILVGVVFFSMNANAKLTAHKISLEEEREELIFHSESFKKTIDVLDDSLKTAESNLKNSENVVKQLSLQFKTEKDKNAQFLEEVNAQKSEIAVLNSSTERLKKENNDAEKRLKLVNEAFNVMKAEFDGLLSSKVKSQSEVEALSDRLMKLTKEKEIASLGTIIVK